MGMDFIAFPKNKIRVERIIAGRTRGGRFIALRGECTRLECLPVALLALAKQ